MSRTAPFLIVTGNDPLTTTTRVTSFGYQINKGFSDLRTELYDLTSGSLIDGGLITDILAFSTFDIDGGSIL